MLEAVRLYLIGFAYKTGVYQRLLSRGLVRKWAGEFNGYWVGVLGRERLSPRQVYARSREMVPVYNQLEIADGDPQAHFDTWVNAPEMDFFLLQTTYDIARFPLRAYRHDQYVPHGARVCEFGCGAAPIAEYFRRFRRSRNVTMLCLDLPQQAYKYAEWRLRDEPWVTFQPLGPDDYAPLQEQFDVIFCTTVFEHLPRPLAIMQHFHDHLKPGGRLIFDYIKSEGVGVDTAAAVEERPAVFAFVRAHFDGRADEAEAGPFWVTKPR